MYRPPFVYGVVVLLSVAACSSSGGGDDGVDTALVDDVVADTAPDDTAATSASGPLAACDGPAKIYVETEVGEREVVDWRGGDALLRGYASCDGDVDRFRIVATCGGSLTARLTWTNADSQLAVTLRADEVDGGTLSDGPATVTLPLAVLDDVDESGDYALDVDVSCVSGEATTWQLDLDTASTGVLPKAANGWPEDLLPGGWTSCEDGRFPYVGPVRDQYGHDDVTAGQFYGDMTVYAISAVWCDPCQQAAAEARELHDRLEAKGSEWGFTLVELLIEDAQGGRSFGPEAPAWAEAFDLIDPVLVGDGVNVAFEACIDSSAIPLLITVDPLGKIRRIVQGAPTLANLEFTLENDWRLFRYEHPEWVSPRCAGVAGAERLCPCDDLAGRGDADGDAVGDACDVCAAGSDRPDYDGDGVPNACDDSPGEFPFKYRPNDGVAITFSAFSPGDGTLSHTPVSFPEVPAGPPSISVMRIQDGDLIRCGEARHFPEGSAAIPDPDDDVLAGWTVPAGGDLSPSFRSCAGLLDPEVWGPDPDAVFARFPEGVALFDRCPLSDCDGRDDPVFESLPLKDCGSDEGCAGYVVGASIWFDGRFLRSPEGAVPGVAWARPANGTVIDPESLLESSEIRANLPAGLYTMVMFIPMTELAAFLAASPGP